jgi:hypothetical protein
LWLGFVGLEQMTLVSLIVNFTVEISFWVVLILLYSRKTSDAISGENNFGY